MLKMNDKKDQKDIRSVFHVSISESEKEQVRKIAKESNMSISEFIRQSVFDKISRIENPELDKSNSQNDSLILEYLRKHDKRLLAMEKILRQRVSNGKVIKSSLEEIKARVNHAKLDFEKEQVIQALKKYGKLRPKEINEHTGIEVHSIYEIISDDSIFSLDITTGRIELKND